MRIVASVFFFLILNNSFAQEMKDSIQAKDTTHSFKRAMIYSAVLPGAGQIYNHGAMPKGQKKAYWKVPLIFAGLGTAGYFTYYNNHLKNQLRTEFEWRDAGNDPLLFTEYDSQGLLSLYSTARTRRDLCFVAVGFVYLLNIVDAGVEAHFVNFDISDDISMNISPRIYSRNTMGVGLTFNFR